MYVYMCISCYYHKSLDAAHTGSSLAFSALCCGDRITPWTPPTHTRLLHQHTSAAWHESPDSLSLSSQQNFHCCQFAVVAKQWRALLQRVVKVKQQQLLLQVNTARKDGAKMILRNLYMYMFICLYVCVVSSREKFFSTAFNHTHSLLATRRCL